MLPVSAVIARALSDVDLPIADDGRTSRLMAALSSFGDNSSATAQVSIFLTRGFGTVEAERRYKFSL
jgi:hypothetical protein